MFVVMIAGIIIVALFRDYAAHVARVTDNFLCLIYLLKAVNDACGFAVTNNKPAAQSKSGFLLAFYCWLAVAVLLWPLAMIGHDLGSERKA